MKALSHPKGRSKVHGIKKENEPWVYHCKKDTPSAILFLVKSEAKKRDTFKNWQLIKNLQFLSNPHETWDDHFDQVS